MLANWAVLISTLGQPFGAITNAQGQYNVLNIPPGTYELRLSRVGYKPLVVREVVVSADNTTWQDATLGETRIATEPVVVTATRPPVGGFIAPRMLRIVLLPEPLAPMRATNSRSAICSVASASAQTGAVAWLYVFDTLCSSTRDMVGSVASEMSQGMRRIHPRGANRRCQSGIMTSA